MLRGVVVALMLSAAPATAPPVVSPRETSSILAIPASSSPSTASADPGLALRLGRPGDEPGWDGSLPRFVPPVDAPIADPFRPPSGPFGPGNRGIEYATAPGSVVRAIGGGVVAFAGPVAGRGVVSIDHPSGLRSTYTGLAVELVVAGTPVAQGQVIGRTSGHLHLGLRDGRRYLDPAAFFGGARAVLVE